MLPCFTFCSQEYYDTIEPYENIGKDGNPKVNREDRENESADPNVKSQGETSDNDEKV